MSKDIFHNNKNTKVDSKLIIKSQEKNIDKKTIVDINKLLNRVKINEKNEIKSKFIYFGSGIFLLSFVGLFLTILK
jgi:hypothetical protein